MGEIIPLMQYTHVYEAWWLPWQPFIETFTEVSKPKYMFHVVLNGVYILYESMYRSKYIDTYQCSTIKCYPQDILMPMKC